MFPCGAHGLGKAYVLLVFLLTGTAVAAPLQGEDDAGHIYHLSRPAQRIITLAPNLTELVYAAGAGAKLVAVSAFSDYPAAARRLPIVGDFARLDMEAVLRLQPDLVLVWQSGNSAGDVRRLAQFGIPVIALEARELSDVARHIALIGELAGTTNFAREAAEHYLRDLRVLEQKYRTAHGVRAFYEIWHQPLMTVGQTQLISRALEVCGARNVFSDLSALTPSVSEEALLARAPQVIVVGASPSEAAARLAAWHRDPLFGPRIERHEIALRYVNADLLHRATPRMLQGLRDLCSALQPAIAKASANR